MRERKDVIAALRRLRVQTGSLACLGCGYEQSCSVRGCAILRAAADLLEQDGAGLAPPNEQLTLEQLRASPHGKIKDSTLQSICNRANEIACRPPEGEI